MLIFTKMTNVIVQFTLINLIAITWAQSDSGCICVPYYMCDSEKREIIRDESADIINPRSNLPCEISTEVCCNQAKEKVPKKTEIQCGIWNKTDEFPWRISILDLNGNILGDGSLIHKRVALTSAGVVLNLNPKRIKIEFADEEKRKVKKIIIHPNYGRKHLQNDIAVIVFDSAIEFTHNLYPVCLPKQDEKLKFTSECFSMCENEESIENLVKIKALSSGKCRHAFERLLHRNFHLHESFMCAVDFEHGHVFKGTGLHGAALICPVSNKTNAYQQIGIFSWGLNRAPSIYSRVSKFRKWIDSEIKKAEEDTFDYLLM